MLSNAYFVAKFRFDAAENEPAKNLPILPILPILSTKKEKRRGPGTGTGRRSSAALRPDRS